MTTRRFRVRGAVQGVGFRPFVYRLAHELGITGWVLNDQDGVCIEATAPADVLEGFASRLTSDAPIHARVESVEVTAVSDQGRFRGFEIRPSPSPQIGSAGILPDLATCPDCLAEVFDSGDRRYRYPFTNCTNCGPRFSIVETLPYDRANTTMSAFQMCAACQAEYEDPLDRRFHAQPNACHDCGPQLRLGDLHADEALRHAVRMLAEGQILAVKGLGGFHLLVNALDDDAVQRLRHRKRRARKPFAVMCADRGQLLDYCAPTEVELQAVTSPAAPIVLIARRAGLAPSVAPGSPLVGAILPYTPLHRLLLSELDMPVVATSANTSGGPICTNIEEVRATLADVADAILDHDRPIRRPVEDSVVAQYEESITVLRRGRGLAPAPVADCPVDHLLGLGAQMRTALAASYGGRVVAGPHIGNLTTGIEVLNTYAAAVCDFEALFGATRKVVDLHPDLLSRRGVTAVSEVQHHHAHAAACMAEHGVESALAVVWDGTGYGTDGTIWGGEFLQATLSSFERVASLRPFRLPGGEAAIREPRRQADGVRFELGLPCADPQLDALLRAGINAPRTTAAGRLFDAVSSLLGFAPDHIEFDGEPAIALEHAARGVDGCALPTPNLVGDRLDWGPLVRAILGSDASPGVLAAGFHDALSRAIADVASSFDEHTVVLTGGCFQNRRLLEQTAQALRARGRVPLWSQAIPPNDGGVAVGQVLVAAARAQ